MIHLLLGNSSYDAIVHWSMKYAHGQADKERKCTNTQRERCRKTDWQST